jgi:hypothetical protein
LEADIAITAEFLAFDLATVNFDPVGANAVPEPGTADVALRFRGAWSAEEGEPPGQFSSTLVS